ncbi:MAG: hypothetical protein P1V19_08985, partial [Gimesia sp.]|nr:hypothetical protein [Gimesia sp.]
EVLNSRNVNPSTEKSDSEITLFTPTLINGESPEPSSVLSRSTANTATPIYAAFSSFPYLLCISQTQ